MLVALKVVAVRLVRDASKETTDDSRARCVKKYEVEPASIVTTQLGLLLEMYVLALCDPSGLPIRGGV